MNIDLKEVLKNKAINEWRLFWLISIPMSITMVIAMMGHDMSTAHGVSEMISFAKIQYRYFLETFLKVVGPYTALKPEFRSVPRFVIE